ncbi:hypothetical protein [Ideonella paludis]|uniref:hypothetical protein n=1 Tax=Ideonella paludis TaxID=1233411 RepID=UPI003641B63E
MCPASSLAAPRAAAAPWARRRWPLAGLLALLTTALAACGGGDPRHLSRAAAK